MLIEICTPTYQSAINAQKGGVHRIELCEDLSVGGITPSIDLIKQVVKELSIPANILIRPRGGDFVYSDTEFNQMLSDIEFCKSIGCNGIVSGVLKSNKTIDAERTKQLIEASKPMSFTFHKAFDEVPDPYKTLDSLIKLGTDRILTSGQSNTDIDGLNTLMKLKNQAKGKLTILVGGGVRADNVLEFKKAGFMEIHSSAIKDSKHSDLEEIKKLSTLCL
jgi:copper homeostasis protein